MRTLTTEAIHEHARMLLRQGASEAALVAQLLEGYLDDTPGPDLTGGEQATLLSSLSELVGWANATHDALRDKARDPRNELLTKLHEHFSRMPGDEVSRRWKAEIAAVVQVPTGPRIVLVLSTRGSRRNEAIMPYLLGRFSVPPVGHASKEASGTFWSELYFPLDTEMSTLVREASDLCKVAVADPHLGCPGLFVNGAWREDAHVGPRWLTAQPRNREDGR